MQLVVLCCLCHNISHLYLCVRTDPCFNFTADRWLFETLSSRLVTLEMVCLIPVRLSPVLQLPQGFCEIGEEQREYQLRAVTEPAPGIPLPNSALLYEPFI